MAREGDLSPLHTGVDAQPLACHAAALVASIGDDHSVLECFSCVLSHHKSLDDMIGKKIENGLRIKDDAVNKRKKLFGSERVITHGL